MDHGVNEAVDFEYLILGGGPAVATIRAVTKNVLLALPRDAFQELIMTHPQILEYMSQLADERRRELDAIVKGGRYREGRVRVV